MMNSSNINDQNYLRQLALQDQPDELSEYWKKPIIGKMPRDQFVQMTGMIANALAPDTWSGRLGAGLAGMGGGAYAERMKREYQKPEDMLRRRFLAAQIKKYEEPDRPNASDFAEDYELDPQTNKYNKVSINKITGEKRVIRQAFPGEVEKYIEIKPEELPSDIKSAKKFGELSEQEKEQFRQYRDAGRTDKTFSEFQRLQGEGDRIRIALANAHPSGDPKYLQVLEARLKEIEGELAKIQKPEYLIEKDQPSTKQIVERRTIDGRKLIKYSDGTIEELK